MSAGVRGVKAYVYRVADRVGAVGRRELYRIEPRPRISSGGAPGQVIRVGRRQQAHALPRRGKIARQLVQRRLVQRRLVQRRLVQRRLAGFVTQLRGGRERQCDCNHGGYYDGCPRSPRATASGRYTGASPRPVGRGRPLPPPPPTGLPADIRNAMRTPRPPPPIKRVRTGPCRVEA